MTIKSTKFSRFKAMGAEKKGGSVVIEGYANKFLSDAYNERMEPTTVKLERYKKNPILLFNHDMNYPCGKVISVEPREDGLFVKAVVSDSSHEKISYVRELVEDGTLCTFSVRFAGETVVEDPEVVGGKLIKDWELQEVSIVSIPAQPDSTFSMANIKSLRDLRSQALKAKGAMVAEYVQEHMEKAVEGGADKEDLVEQVAQKAGVDVAMLADVLAGNVTPVPEPVLGAFVDVLGCDKVKLDEANAGDVEKQKSAEMPKDEEKPEGEQKADPMSQEMQQCVSEKIPTLMKEGKEQDQAVAIAIDMCKKEKSCSFVPTKTMLAQWLNECDKIKQAEQSDTPKEGAAVPNMEPEGMNDNALLMLLKSQLEMLGAISVKLDALKEVMSAKVEPKPEAPKAEEPKMEEMKGEEEAAMKSILDKYEARLKSLLG